jgi:uncharacterized membrane protein YczE
MSSLAASNQGWVASPIQTTGQHAITGWRRHLLLYVASAALLLLGATYVGYGLRHLVSTQKPATDLHMRWLEQRYVYNGQNPYDVIKVVRSRLFDLPPPECPRDNRVDPRIGKPYQRAGGYPPWAFPSVAPIVLPTRWPVTTAYFALVNILALTITFIWAYRIGRPHGPAGGVFLGAAAVAVFGNYRSLQVGQYSILVTSLLIGVYWLVQKNKAVAGGIVFGLAALKPQVSAVFGLGFVVRRQWRALAAATAYVVVASIITWVLTKTDPIEMLQQMYALGQSWVDHPNPRVHEQIPMGSCSFSSVLLDLHLERTIATPLAAIVGFTLAGVLMWLWRDSSTLTLFAIAATTGRLWSYHRPYDDVMLIFLLVALGKLTLTHRSIGTVLAFCLVGLSLWAWFPIKFPPLALQIAIMSSWLFGLAVLLAWEPRSGQVGAQIDLNESTVSSRDGSSNGAGIRSFAQRGRTLCSR